MFGCIGETPWYWEGEFHVPVDPAGDVAAEISSRRDCVAEVCE